MVGDPSLVLQRVTNSLRWFCKALGTNHKRVLSLESQKMFLEKDFVAFQFTELTPEQEEDLFARVQMGVQLTVAEKMRAKQGPWQELAKLFVEDFPAIYNLMKDRARAKDFQLTLACFSQIVEVKHPTAANGVPILKTNYSVLPKLLSNTGVVDDAIKSHLASVWTTFKELVKRDPDIFTNSDKHLSGVQTFAPVEMVAVTVLISMYSETRNNELLIRDIKALREALREHFKDLRLHTTVWKFVWDFIENLEGIRGAVDGTTVNRNQLDQASWSTPSSATATAIAITTVSSTPSVSRKRATPANKPLSILPPRNLVVMKNERRQNTDVAKRQRTDLGPSNAQTLAFASVHEDVYNSHITDASTDISERMCPATVTRQHPIVGNMFAQYGLQQQPPTKSTSASPQLNTMSNQGSHTGSMVLSRTPNMTQTYPTSRGAFAPTHTEKQWEGIMTSASPKMAVQAPSATKPAVPSSASLSATSAMVALAPQPNSRKQNSVTRPTPAQYRGDINLTSDNQLEEKRQNLLSSFKAKSSPAKQHSAPATPAAKASTAPTRRDHVVIHDIDSDEEPALAKNPYQRF